MNLKCGGGCARAYALRSFLAALCTLRAHIIRTCVRGGTGARDDACAHT